MKTARTFTIDTDLAKDLRQKRNQSQFVEDAIKSKMYPSSQTKHISEYTKYELLTRLIKFYAEETMEHRLLNNMWKAEYQTHTISLDLDANP